MEDIYLKGFVILIFMGGIWFVIHRINQAREIIKKSKRNVSYNNFHKEKKDMNFWLERKYLDHDYLLFQITDEEEYISLISIYKILRSKSKNEEKLKASYSKKGLEYFNGEDIVKLDEKDMRLESDMDMGPGYRASNLKFETFLDQLMNINFKSIKIYRIIKYEKEYKLIEKDKTGFKHGVILFDKGHMSYDELSILVELLKSFSMKNIISNKKYHLI